MFMSTLFIVLLFPYAYTMASFTASDIDVLRMVTLNKIDSFGNIDDGAELKPLIASIVRLVFHDCIGPYNPGETPSSLDDSIRICDGCIDFDAIDHAGIQEFALQPMVEICHPFADKLNTADCWAAVGTIALEYAASLSDKPGSLPSIPYFTGRRPCASSPDATISPTTHFPSPHLGWDPMFDFFEQYFDFDIEESTAIMGAHTLGRAHKTGSGFDGKWTLDPWALNNRFFVELLDKSNEWDQTDDTSGGSPQWTNAGRTPDEEELTMLNVDIGMIADFEDHEHGDTGPPFIDDMTGIVSCRWEGFIIYEAPLCPREQSFGIALTYALDNQRFLMDFAIVWERLITNNYHDLIEINANEFRDVREDDDISLYPSIAPSMPTVLPSKTPTITPTIR
eukprot:529439_1